MFTCWSTPTASSPSYMILTQPSLHDSTNRDIRAWWQKHRDVKKCCFAKKCYQRKKNLLETGHGDTSHVPKLVSFHSYLNQVVKIVLSSYPAVVGLLTVRPVCDVFCIQTLTVIELPFEKLKKRKIRVLRSKGLVCVIISSSQLQQCLLHIKHSGKKQCFRDFVLVGRFQSSWLIKAPRVVLFLIPLSPAVVFFFKTCSLEEQKLCIYMIFRVLKFPKRHFHLQYVAA